MNKYVLDHSPMIRSMLDLISANAEHRAGSLRKEIELLNTSPVSEFDFDRPNQVRFLEQQIEFATAVAKNPELAAVEAGARQLASEACDVRPYPACGRVNMPRLPRP